MKRLLAPLAAVAALCAQDAASPPLRGFPVPDTAEQHRLEREYRALTDRKNMRVYLERMAAEPHHAGSPGSKRVAGYILDLFRSWGLEARIEEFDALLPYPTERVVELVKPTVFKAKLHEPAIPEDKDSGDASQLPTYHAYAASGDVTAPLVYVNYGIPEDYVELKKLGVSVKGKIVLARYGRSWRGTKAKMAQENGAVGCLIYSDPKDDGFFQGDVYPAGSWRPPLGVQRGSLMDMPLYVGDPLTPGWPSVSGTKRLKREEAGTLMKIPVLPLSYEEARPLLEQLAGKVAPVDWRGALPVTYHLGPGPAEVRMKTGFDWTSKPFYNVIATIRGSEFPDEWVVYGNHHDAWVNGAHDPVSGAASVLETARATAQMAGNGWRPKRTIVFALWDAEEFGLVGSTEWAEKHGNELKEKTIAYINSDSNGNGKFSAGGSPALQVFFTEVIRDVSHPEKSGAVLDNTENFRLSPLGAGSDYVVFAHHLGLPSLNVGFSHREGGGIYHSIYDTIDWYTKFSDGDLSYGETLAEVLGTALMRLAGARLMPHDFRPVVSAVREYVAEIEKIDESGKVDFEGLYRALESYGLAAADYDDRVREGGWEKASPNDLAAINRVLRTSEQALLLEDGLPGRPWYKHPLSAPGVYTGYGAKTLPWIREAVEAGRFEDARQGVKVAAEALRRMESRIAEAARLVSGLAD